VGTKYLNSADLHLCTLQPIRSSVLAVSQFSTRCTGYSAWILDTLDTQDTAHFVLLSTVTSRHTQQ